jgi:hypothetical protein
LAEIPQNESDEALGNKPGKVVGGGQKSTYHDDTLIPALTHLLPAPCFYCAGAN